MYEGVLTGKGLSYGGSLARKEATGYGLLYFTNEMLKLNGQELAGKTVAVSGSGNVAIYATEKAQELGAKVVTVSDSTGWVYDPEGIDLAALKEIDEELDNRVLAALKEIEESRSKYNNRSKDKILINDEDNGNKVNIADFRDEQTLTIAQAFNRRDLSGCNEIQMNNEKIYGKISGESVYVYPPGIPILCPGEVITRKIIAILEAAGEAGLEVVGVKEGALLCLR